MRHIIWATISNIAETNQLFLKHNLYEWSLGKRTSGVKRSIASRFFRAALATTSALALAQAMMAITPRPATAQTWTGASSTDWQNSGNWSGGVPSGGNTTIATSSPNRTVLGSGSGSTGNLFINGTGNLTVQNGVTLTSTGWARLSEAAGGSPVVTVTGTNSKWNATNNLGLIVGNNGDGTLTVSNGGAVNVTTYSHIGAVGSGILNILSGGKMSTGTNSYVGGEFSSQAGNGTVTVDGAGSQWTVGGPLVLGFGTGTGTLNIQNGGAVIASSGVTLGNQAASKANININGGTLQTSFLKSNLGTITISLNNATLRATTSSATFVSGFNPGQLVLNGQLTIDSQANNVTVASPFTGTGSLRKTGSGNLILSGGGNTFSGGTFVTQGTVTAGSDTAYGTGTLTVDSGATANIASYNVVLTGGLAGQGTVNLGTGKLTLNPTTDTQFSGILSGGGTLTKGGTGTLTLSNTSNNYTGGTTITGGKLSVSADSNLGNGGGIILNGGTLQVTGTSYTSTARTITMGSSGGGFDIAAASNTFTVSQVLAGTGGLTKQGAGTLVLTGANTYQGTTTISAGTLQIGAGGTAGALGTGAVVNNAALVFNRSDSTFTIGNGISGTGAVTKNGNGNLTLAGSNAYSGGLTINAGRVTAGSTTAFGSGLLTVAASGTASLDNKNITVGGLAGAGSVLLGSGTLTLNQAGATTFSGAITGTGGVVKSGAGNLTLSGSNSFSGGLTINAGTVTAGSANAYGGGTLNVANGATAALSTSATVGGLMGAGNIALNAGTLTVNQAANTTFSGAITGTGGGLVKGGAGNLTLTGGSSFSGDFTANAGSVTVNGSSASISSGNLVIGAANGSTTGLAVQSGARVTTTGYARLGSSAGTGTANATVTNAGSSWTVNGSLGLIVANDAGNSTLTISDRGAVNVTAGGTGVGRIRGTGTLTIESGGTLTSSGGAWLGGNSTSEAGTGIATVTGTNSAWTVTGALAVGNGGSGTLTIGGGGTVTAGSAIVASGGSASGTITVNTSGTLAMSSLQAGAGTGTKSVVFDGGTLKATGANGTDFISGFTGTQFAIASGGMVVDTNGFDVATAAANVLSGAGVLTKTGAGDLTLSGGNTFSGGTTVNEGTATAGAAGTAFGTGLLTVTGPGAAALDGFDTTVAGISGDGAVSLGAGTLTVDYAGTGTTYSGVMSGTGGFVKSGSGTQVLSGANSYTGTTTVSGGTLVVDGDQSAATGATTVASSATLSGSGTLGGDVDVAAGGRLLSQNSNTGDYTLTVNGDLTLATGANLDYVYGKSPNTDPDALLVEVKGDLHLNSATLNVTNNSLDAFDPGVYGIVQYDGTMDGALTLGTVPAGMVVQTAVAGRLSLVNTAGATLNFWDPNGTVGSIEGGDGTWTADNGDASWTNAAGAFNGPYAQDAVAIFTGTAATPLDPTVTVDNSAGAINVAGMQFVHDGYIITGGELTLQGDTVNNRSSIIVGDRTGAVIYTATIGSKLTGTATLVKEDAGILVLSNANNDYSGGTRIEDGTVRISADGDLGRTAGGDLTTRVTFAGGTLQATGTISTARPVTLEAGGGTFDVDAAKTLTLTGLVDGAGALTKDGAGTLTLSGANTYGGGTTVEAGTLTAGSDTAFGAATGTLTVNGGTADLAGHSMTLAGLEGSGGAVKLGDATSGASVLTLNQSADLSYAGVISGTGSLVKNGTGDLMLSGANRFSGGLTVGGGTVTAGSDTAFGSGVLTVNGGTADLAGHSMTLAGLAGSGGEVKTGTATPGATLTLNQAGDTSYAGVVSGTGVLVKQGAGDLTLSGANTFSGGLTVDAGTLTAGSATAFGAASGVLTVNGGTADLNGQSMTLAGLKGSGGTVDLGSATLTLDQTIDTAYAGKVTGTGGLKKAGTGKLTLSGANDFRGGVTLNNGDLVAGSGTAFGSGPLAVNAGTADLDGHSMTLAALSGNGGNVKLGAATLTLDQTTTTIAHAIISGTGGITMNGAGTLTLAGANIFTGPLTVAAGTVKAGNAAAFGKGLLTVNGGVADLNGNAMTLAGLAGTGGTVRLGAQTLTLDQTATTSYAGAITGSGGLVMDGTGQLTLSGNNSFSGGLTVREGTVRAGSATAFGAATGILTVDGGTADLNGNSMTLAGLAGAGGEVKTGTATLTLQPTTTVSYAGRISGAGGLTINGTGRQVLSGASTYTGPTKVSKGTLAVNGSITSPTTVTGAGSTLAGRGSITGDVSILNGGSLYSYDDNADGQNRLAITGKLTVDAASSMDYHYGRTPALDPDVLMVDVTGDVDLNGTVNVTADPAVTFGPGVYGLVQYTGSRTGTLRSGTLPTGLTLQTAIAGSINLVNLDGTARDFWDPAGAAGDGLIKGGNGTWDADTGGASWATEDGTTNGFYQNTFAVFAGDPGTVTVDNGKGQIAVSGMQFTVDGYTVRGGAITLDNATGVGGSTPGETSIVVGNRTGTSHSHVVTIASVLQGTDRLVKEDVGTLVLSGINTYSGGTLIDDGTLQIADDRNLGADAAGALTTALAFDGTAYVAATLNNTAAISMTRPVTLNGAGGTFQTDADLTLNGTVGGPGALTKTGAAKLTLTGANNYAGGTLINAGTVSVSADGNLGAADTGITLDGGTLENTAAFTTSARTVTVGAAGGTFETDADLTLSGVIRGTAAAPATGGGPLEKKGAGRLILTADSNDYTGTMTVSQGELVFGNASNGGGSAGAIAGPIVDNAALSFDRADAFTYAGLISGSGTLTQKGSGATTLSAANSYKGATTVAAGTLVVNGDQSAATGATTVMSGATIRGRGIIGGDLTVQSGGNLTAQDEAGSGISALTIARNLTLDPGASLNYNYGVSPNGDHDALMVHVGGDLVLNGTLNVANTSGTDFEAGVYGLIRYGGSLSGAGLTLGTMPGSGFLVQTSVDGRVNLAYTAGQTLNFWDGSRIIPNGKVDGGSGTWQAAAGSTNWTTHGGNVNAGYADDSVPIFMGTSGTVTVDDSLGVIRVAGMQFAVSGYTIQGDAITLTSGRTGIRVGEGGPDSNTYVATIASELTGAGQLAKTDLGTLILTGANSYTGGTLIDSGTLQVSRDANLGATAGNLALDGGTLENTAAFTSARAVALDANGGTFQTDKDLTLAGRLTGTGSLTKTGAATLMLSGTSTYTGATFVKSGTLAAGRAGAFSPASAFDIAAAGTLDLKGYDQSVGSLTNAGRVSLAGSNPGTTLTVNGDYTAKAGSTVALSTKLEGDDSRTDRLVVKGATAGATTLAVTNAGGGGAQTDKGIKLVEVDGASNATFTLAGDYVFEGDQALVAGAYAYRLFKNGIDTNDGDWYLRSSLLEEDIPQFQAGVPVYEAYAGVLQAFNQFDTLQSRLGNRSWTIEAEGADGLSDEVAPELADGQNLGVWGSIEAARHRYRPEHSTSSTDYDAAVWKLQAGIDGQFYESEAGRLIGGASLHYGTVSADIFSPHGDGKIDTTGYGIAGTLTWYGSNGFYLDGQAKLTFYDSDLSSLTANESLVSGNDGRGYGLSVEAGRRIPVRPDWFITPQAQLAWSRVEFDGFSDGFDADVTLNDGDSLIARMGLAIDHENEWQDDRGQTRRLHAYGIANLYYDFDTDLTIDVASTPFTTKNQPLWAGIGIGGSYNWNNDKFSIYGQAIAKTSIDNFTESNIISGNVGLRVKW